MPHAMIAKPLPRSTWHSRVKVWLVLPKDDVANCVIKARSNQKRMEDTSSTTIEIQKKKSIF